MIIIPCGKTKAETTEPIMAKDLYTGSFFAAMLRTAICLDSDVRILSAYYGPLELNTLVLPYNVKMTPTLAMWFKKNNIVTGNGKHLCPEVYGGAMPETIRPLLPKALGMGEILSALLSLIGEKIPLFDVNMLVPGEKGMPVLAENEDVKQYHRTGGRLGICAFIGDLFTAKWLTIEDACFILEKEFGPAGGLSYKPTITRQLRIQATKRGLTIEKKKKEDSRKYLFHYVKQ